MRNPDRALGARIAGALLVAVPALDIIVGVRAPGPVHAIVGYIGLALLAVDSASTNAKEKGHEL